MSDHIRSTGPGSTKVTGSSHYKKLAIEPIEYIEANNLPFHEGEIVKYITRWRDKDGIKDLEKVEWYIHRLMEREQKREQPVWHGSLAGNGIAVCGADYPNMSTTTVRYHVTCPSCRMLMG